MSRLVAGCHFSEANIIVTGGPGALYSKKRAATDVTNSIYLVTVNFTLASLDTTIDYESIDSHLIDDNYETTVNNYFISSFYENKWYHITIKKASK